MNAPPRTVRNAFKTVLLYILMKDMVENTEKNCFVLEPLGMTLNVVLINE